MATRGTKATSGLESLKASAPSVVPDLLVELDPTPVDKRPPMLPDACPVTPLGHIGQKLVFLDRSKQFVTASTKCEKGDLMLWFGNGWLEGQYPSYSAPKQKGDPPEINGFNQKHIQIALVEDCWQRGIFNPAGRVFGRGAHRARGNPEQLVLHMGARVLIAGPGLTDRKGKPTKGPATFPSGLVGDALYPALPALPPPADQAADKTDGAALLSLIGKWYWIDRAASARLLLGFVAQMFVCGALEWRTHVWLVGPTAAGKTHLQKLIRAIHGEWCLHTEDASEAALRQVLGDDTLPVLIDEAEAHDNPERQRAIVNLMKKASSGAKIYRGSADHKATEFTAQSCFLLSSVLHASLKGEDRNRIAILEMREVPAGVDPLELELAAWRAMGRKLHRRMIEQWPRFERTLADYKRAIARENVESRYADTYGCLLACADLLLYDHAPNDTVAAALDEPGPERVMEAIADILPMMARARVEARSDVERVQQHLLTNMVPGSGGKPPESLGSWLTRAMERKYVAGQFQTDEGEWVVDEEARAKLRAYGLRVVAMVPKNGATTIEDARAEDWEGAWLAVAYATNKATAEIFRGSEWADGGWIQSLGKIPEAEKGRKVRFAGPKPDNAVLVPLKALLGTEG